MKKILLLLCVLFQVAAVAADRADELRAEMWNSTDKSFLIKVTPEKWATKSAIIIGQMNRFEYRKPLMTSYIRANEYHHYRIKLNDKNAVDKYSEMTFGVNTTELNVYVGYKVVKPDGKENIVDIGKAVKMEKTVRGRTMSYNKLAIPGLEPGDILDYYVCEETTQLIYNYILFFDPVIYSLPREYPIMNYKIQFRASRKCYINIKSINGAPEYKLVTDENNDEQYYSIEGSDMESVEDQRWIYRYRELPTIKFRAAYSKSGNLNSFFDVLLGEVKKAKTNVSKDELERLGARMVEGTYYEPSLMKKYEKTGLKGVTDPFKVAMKQYYYLRNELFFKNAEELTWKGNVLKGMSDAKFVGIFHQYLTKKKIAHDVIIAVSRSISPIQDVIMENELNWLIRVKKGKEYLYLSPIDINVIPGTFSEMLEGTEAYALNGLAPTSTWKAEKFTMPVLKSVDHKSVVNLKIQLTDMTKSKVSVRKELYGNNKLSEQNAFIDFYDYEKEERAKFKSTPASYKGQSLALKKAYLDKRDAEKVELLKNTLEDDYSFKVINPDKIVIEKTGRYDDEPAMVYGFLFETEELVKKTGPNYMLDAGKLIEGQVKIDGEELDRKTNIYFDNARLFNYHIDIEIPDGFTVEGIEKLNSKVESAYGGFTSSAKIEGGHIIIETNKHYDVNYVQKEDWKSVVEFLNAAYNFNDAKLLFKKQ